MKKVKNCCYAYTGASLFRRGYVMHKCFSVAVCMECGDVQFTCAWPLRVIFRLFFAPFWDKTVKTDLTSRYIARGGKLYMIREGGNDRED